MTEEKKKRNKNYYFTKIHEEAVVKYASTEDLKIRTELYIELIEPAFSELVDKIIYTYKFTSLPNIDVLKDECKIWLTTILDKYDPNRGSKAFSYFSVITKNWFIHRVKKNSQKSRREINYDDITKDLEQEHLSARNPYETKREDAEFWHYLWKEIETWEAEDLKPNEEKVLLAVRVLLEKSNEIEIFNKKAVYLYLRELTGLNTKQVVNNLNKLRSRYHVFRKTWNDGKI
jgi:DNA-directed RNA polymerase specialized sigma subunit|tara:strand:- start:264 stop:956 length:693 start_codon:yes stop_codon:yes gene_type:complete